MTFTGFVNPVSCALHAVELMYDGSIDRESFQRLAVNRGSASPEVLREGFIVRGHEDLAELCEIGNFVIAFGGDGLVRAYEPDEYAWAKR